MGPGQHATSVCDVITIKEEPEMGPGQHATSVCDVITIKEEPEEAKPLMFLKQETEYVSVKEENMEEAKPLMFLKQEFEYVSVKEENMKWEEPDGHNSTQDPLSTVKEECSPSEELLGPNTCNIYKQRTRKMKGAASEDDREVLSGGQTGNRQIFPESSNKAPPGEVNLERSYQICQAGIQNSANRDRLRCRLKPPPIFLASNLNSRVIGATKKTKISMKARATTQDGVVTSQNGNGQTSDSVNTKAFTSSLLANRNSSVSPSNGNINNNTVVSNPVSVTSIGGQKKVTRLKRGPYKSRQQMPPALVHHVCATPQNIPVLLQSQADPVPEVPSGRLSGEGQSSLVFSNKPQYGAVDSGRNYQRCNGNIENSLDESKTVSVTSIGGQNKVLSLQGAPYHSRQKPFVHDVFTSPQEVSITTAVLPQTPAHRVPESLHGGKEKLADTVDDLGTECNLTVMKEANGTVSPYKLESSSFTREKDTKQNTYKNPQGCLKRKCSVTDKVVPANNKAFAYLHSVNGSFEENDHVASFGEYISKSIRNLGSTHLQSLAEMRIRKVLLDLHMESQTLVISIPD